MRFAKRTDANHAAVRDALRADGFDVLDLSAAGDGIPDLCVRINMVKGTPVLSPHTPPVFLELKDGDKPKSARKLTAKQELWHRHCWAVTHTVTNIDEARAALAWAANRAKEKA
jgi:hypothetical protein